MVQSFRSKEKRKHWLDHADDKYDKNLIEDVKSLLRVLVLFIPLPVFWALFDQQVFIYCDLIRVTVVPKKKQIEMMNRIPIAIFY